MASKATAQIDEQTAVEVDFTAMEKRIIEHVDNTVKPMMEKYLKEAKEVKESKGKGIVEGWNEDQYQKGKAVVVEEFKKGENLDPHKIKEQWTICVPKYAIYELAGHLRDFVFVTDAVKGRPGETVNIPFVNDVEFEHAATPHTSAWSGKADLINVLTTTLHESGTYYDAYYGDIEKIDSNMLEELNRVFAHAAIRAEDDDLIALINTATQGEFRSEGGGTDSLNPYFVGTSASALSLNMVAEALGAFMRRGKEIHPGELILYTNAKHYMALIKLILQSTQINYARPDYIQKGLIEDFLGVKIVIGGKQAMNHGLCARCGTTSLECMYLMRPKRALALAPKRDILIETDKRISERQLRIAASHTYGVAKIDMTEVVPIYSLSGT